MCGYGRFGREVTADLRAAGLEVTIIEAGQDLGERGEPEPGVIVGDASEPGVLARADLASAVGLVAGTDNDTTNLSMLATARRLNPQLFLAARQNQPTSAALFEAMRVDALLVPTEVVAHEVYAQISTPMLWRFIQEMPAQGDEWAADLIQRLRYNCGRELPALWKVKLDAEQAPALGGWLADGRVALGDLLRSPEDRERRLLVVPLAAGPRRRGDPDARRRDGAGRPTMSCCSPGTAPSDENLRAPWWSTRPQRTCCSISRFHRAGYGASCPGRTERRARSTTAAT